MSKLRKVWSSVLFVWLTMGVQPDESKMVLARINLLWAITTTMGGSLLAVKVHTAPARIEPTCGRFEHLDC